MKSNLISNTVVKPRPMEPTLVIQKNAKSYVVLTIPSLYTTDKRHIAGVVVWNDGSEYSLKNNKVGSYAYEWVWDHFEVLDPAKSLTLANE